MKRLINTERATSEHKIVRIAKPRNPLALLLRGKRAGKHTKTHKQQRAARRSHDDML